LGVAVLLSMMAIPHKKYRYHWHCWLVYEQCQYQPFCTLGCRCGRRGKAGRIPASKTALS
jgi:hypothetical protein